MAGLVDDRIKGFHVLDAACQRLWQSRRDFELVVTGDPPGQVNEYTRYIGWLSQEELPGRMRQADIIVVPTVAQDALGRTAVEAMAASRPVVASRLGGLPYTVADGAGLLFEPGDADDLARKLRLLLDDWHLRRTMGALGRRRFEEHFTWQAVIDKHYRPLLAVRRNATEGVAYRNRATEATPLAPSTQTRSVSEAPGQPIQIASEVSEPTRPYTPFIPNSVDHGLLLRELHEALGIEPAAVGEMFDSYRAFHRIKGYEYKLGELKTLCFEEAFVLHALFAALRPRTVLEIGTQHGKATRRLIDSLALLGLDTRVVTCDIADQVEHFKRREAELVVEDVTGRFRERLLERFAPDIVFVDAHPYALLDEIVRECLAVADGPALAIHDCSRGLCNPGMAIAKDDPNVTSATGVWERHILAAHFGVADCSSGDLDHAANESQRLTIFATPHGLGLVLPIRDKSGVHTVADFVRSQRADEILASTVVA